MKKRQLSRREQEMVEKAVTWVCRDQGAGQEDEDTRQAAWAEILSVWREDPGSFQGSAGRGWERAYRLAGQAVREELGHRQRQRYGEVSLDAPVRGDTETTLLQLLHSPTGSCEGSVCLWDYLSRQHPDVQRAARAMLEGETPGQLRTSCQWSQRRARWALRTLREAMEEYLRIQ